LGRLCDKLKCDLCEKEREHQEGEASAADGRVCGLRAHLQHVFVRFVADLVLCCDRQLVELLQLVEMPGGWLSPRARSG